MFKWPSLALGIIMTFGTTYFFDLPQDSESLVRSFITASNNYDKATLSNLVSSD